MRGIEPGDRLLGEQVAGVIDPVGGHDGFEQPPQVLQRVECRRAEREPGDGDVGRLGSRQDPLGMVGRCVLPAEQLGHVGTEAASVLAEGAAIVLAAALADHLHQLAGRSVERAVDHPPAVAPRNDNDPLLATPGPPGPQRRTLAQRRLLATPARAARCQQRDRLLDQRPFFAA